jgi:hypothetical protein
MEEFRIDPSIAYDVVELPSRGIYYSNGKKSLRVAYLTASDENILSSPNYMQNNSIIDELLKRKVLDKDIQIEDIVEDDRQAILIFLRNTAFGSEFKIRLTDPKTNEEFTETIDLSNLKFREFNLVSDANGEYKYVMPKSNIDVTFKFLNKKQEKDLEDIANNWNGIDAAPVITKRLEMMIKSVAGVRDQMNTRNFVINLPIKDSQDFRKFILENKPSLDLNRKIKTPSGEIVDYTVNFGVDFFRPFYGL